MSGRRRLLNALEGGAAVSPPAAPLYLSLYLEPRRRKLLAQVYAEMAERASSLRLTFEEEIEARLEALTRAVALFADPPLPVTSPHQIHLDKQTHVRYTQPAMP